jgi:hypothetical protein
MLNLVVRKAIARLEKAKGSANRKRVLTGERERVNE